VPFPLNVPDRIAVEETDGGTITIMPLTNFPIGSGINSPTSEFAQETG
jgi:hypothetical protein